MVKKKTEAVGGREDLPERPEKALRAQGGFSWEEKLWLSGQGE